MQQAAPGSCPLKKGGREIAISLMRWLLLGVILVNKWLVASLSVFWGAPCRFVSSTISLWFAERVQL